MTITNFVSGETFFKLLLVQIHEISMKNLELENTECNGKAIPSVCTAM